MALKNKESLSRISYLEGLRGFASIVVVLYHYLLFFYPALFTIASQHSHTADFIEKKIALTPISILYNGSLAVCFFFTLSGYVLSINFFRKRDLKYPSSAFIKRYFRLIIPILFSVIVAAILIKSNFFYNSFVAINISLCPFAISQDWNIIPNLWSMLKEGLYTSVFKGNPIKYNPVLWTMNIEFMGSLLTFAILSLIGKLKNRYFIYSIIILFFFNTYFLAFIAGVCLCDFNYSHQRKTHISLNILLFLIAIYLGSYQFFNTQNIWSILDNLFIQNRQTLAIIASFLFLFICTHSFTMQNIFSKNIFRLAGKISFSLYLIHVLFLGSFSCYLFIYLYTIVKLSYFNSFILMLGLSLIILSTISFFVYKYIDLIGIRFSSYLYKKLFGEKEKHI